MRLLGCFLMVGLMATSSAYAKEKLESRWLDREVTVDGDWGDWKDAMGKVENTRATLGVMNDGTHLYVCLRSWDPQANFLAMSRGLILRLTPKGKSDLGVGIRFPVGMEGDVERGSPGRRRHRGQDGQPGKHIQAFKDSLAVVEILERGEGKGKRLALDSSLGFELRAEMDEGMLVYEVKIPLLKSSSEPYAVGAEPGTMINVSFETPEPDAAARPERMGSMGGGRGGGRPGVGMGGRMGGRGGPPPDRLEAPEPLNMKAKVRLAKSP